VASLKKRGSVWFVQWYEGDRQRRRSLGTDSLQVAKEKLRRFESGLYRGEDCPLPTRMPVGEVVAAYIDHMRAHRPERSWKRDLSYLRESFGECCPALELTSQRAKKCRELRLPEDRRRKLWPIAATHVEDITTAAVSDFLSAQVRAKGLAPKTANRYREVVGKLINWAMKSGRVRMPLDRNPTARVDRYREHAPEIRFLTLEQIEKQLEALRFRPQLQAMVATLIYAGLRREELLWLQVDDSVRPNDQAPNGLLRIRAKTVAGESWQPKTKKNRAAPISRGLRRFLDAHTPRASEAGWLFPSPEGTRWHLDNFSQDLRAVNEAAGLVWSCLDYRHTFGSQLAQRGVSLYQLATLMGNCVAISQRHYAAISNERLSAVLDFCSVT
jgi:site-specific recombinase XerD